MANKPSDDEIKVRAYEIYLERGCEPGRDVEDWLSAEQELSDLAAAKLSWLGTERGSEQELIAPSAETQDPQTAKKKIASA